MPRLRVQEPRQQGYATGAPRSEDRTPRKRRCINPVEPPLGSTRARRSADTIIHTPMVLWATQDLDDIVVHDGVAVIVRAFAALWRHVARRAHFGLRHVHRHLRSLCRRTGAAFQR